MRRLLDLHSDGRRSGAEVEEVVMAQIAEVDRKVADSLAMPRALLEIAVRCRGGEGPECLVIDDVAGGPFPSGFRGDNDGRRPVADS